MSEHYITITKEITKTVHYESGFDAQTFVTVTGFKHYYGLDPFQIGQLIRCRKEPGNPYDSDAIRAFLPVLGTVGYLANAPQTKAGGTLSAGRVYAQVPDRFYIRVLFTTLTKVICRVETDRDLAHLDAELNRQLAARGSWDEADFSPALR